VRLTRIPSFDGEWNRRYRPRVTGAFVGTTDEIIQWAACKWGLSDEVLRAQAVAESFWKQSQLGDFEPRSEGHCTVHDRGDPCPTSFGLLQVKWYYSRPAYPYTRVMTSFQVDWSAAWLRGCYDGRKWHPGGDFWACVGNWWSGGWNDPGALAYIERVRTALERREWATWADRGTTVPYRTGLRPRGRSPGQ
jgi:autotransporter family porin